MRVTRIAFACGFGLAVAGCAGSVSAPEAVQALPAQQQGTLHVSDISADATNGVQMGDNDFDAICQKVRGYIQTSSPEVLADTGYKMKIHFTRFDRGSAFARAMLIGLGQIEIDATVDLVDNSGAQVAEYKVSKDFAIGGLIGATTTVEDVEDGFAKSVAEIVKTKV
jgi:hypothetical protein